METAKIFLYRGSQAVQLPKAFRLSGSEVLIEKHGEKVIFKPMPATPFQSFEEIAEYLAERICEESIAV